MAALNSGYLERIRGVLYVEKKVVNYKTVSLLMGVHVNLAKQMLYHLHKVGNEEGQEIFATYYVSGMVTRPVLRSLETEGGIPQGTTFKEPEADAYLVAICKEQDLEDLKAKYSKIFSVHLYSLSAFPIENCGALANLVEFPMKDSQGRTPVDFGPVTCSAARKLKTPPDSGRSGKISDSGVPQTIHVETNVTFKKPAVPKPRRGRAKGKTGEAKAAVTTSTRKRTLANGPATPSGETPNVKRSRDAPKQVNLKVDKGDDKGLGQMLTVEEIEDEAAAAEPGPLKSLSTISLGRGGIFVATKKQIGVQDDEDVSADEKGSKTMAARTAKKQPINKTAKTKQASLTSFFQKK